MEDVSMFKSAKSNKVSEHIIEQIRKAIFEGKLLELRYKDQT